MQAVSHSEECPSPLAQRRTYLVDYDSESKKFCNWIEFTSPGDGGSGEAIKNRSHKMLFVEGAGG